VLRHHLSFADGVGVIGGRPRRACYYVGVQQTAALYLDPHFVQPYVDMSSAAEDFSVASYHCHCMQAMQFTDMDPSMAFGWLLRSDADVGALKEFFALLAGDERQLVLVEPEMVSLRAEHK